MWNEHRLKEAFHTLSMRDLNHATLEEIVLPTGESSQEPELWVLHPSVMHLQILTPQVHYVVLRSHLSHLIPQELVHFSYNIDTLASNVDVIDVRIRLATTGVVGIHFRDFLIKVMWRFRFTARQSMYQKNLDMWDLCKIRFK